MDSVDEKITGDSFSGDIAPGRLLADARERMGLSQEWVAKELYMTVTKVCALEADDFRHMGGDTFARGYLRAYANLVKLDVVQVLAAYDRHAQKHGLVEQLSPCRVESPNKPLWQFVVLILVAMLILWLVSIWFFDNRQQPDYKRPTAIVPPVEAEFNAQSINASSVSQDSSVGGSVFVPPILVSENEAKENAAKDEAMSGKFSDAQNSSAVALANSFVSSIASSIRTAQVSDTNQLDSIHFSFTQECWVEVSDARGDVLVADLQLRGSHLLLQGNKPFHVKLGNAPGAEIELNGDKVAVVPALGTNVLSLTVGESTHE